jgi:hypothetical protein
MPTIETRDGIFLDIPEGMAPDAPEVKAAVQQERLGRRHRSPEYKAKALADQEQDRATYDPTVGMGAGAKTLANIGAGMSNAWEGLKQITPGVKGMSDEQLREKRAIDQRLAEKTDLGIAPDWAPTAGSALQFAGEMAPSLVIPAGGAGMAARVGGRFLPKAVAALGGAAGGAASGALAPVTSDESRAMNMVTGGVAGGALPLAVGATKGLWRMRPGAGGRAARAGEMLADELGPQAGATEASLRAHQPGPTTANIPTTAGEVTGSPVLGRMERTSASGAPEDWAQFRRAQNEGTYDALREATGDATSLEHRADYRDLATGAQRERAIESATAHFQRTEAPMERVAKQIAGENALASPSRKLANMALAEVGEGTTPQKLYSFRKLLASKLEGPMLPGDETAAIIKGAQVDARKLIAAIDAGMERGAPGDWGNYLSTYSQLSRPVDSSVAQRSIREAIDSEGAKLYGSAPEVTRHKLGRAMEQYGRNEFGDVLEPRARASLDELLGHLKQREELQSTLKSVGTSGGGSNTTMDVLGHAAAATRGGLKIAGREIPVLKQIAAHLDSGAREELVGLLQNPRAAADAIAAASARRAPLTPAQLAFRTAMNMTIGGALPRTMQANQPQGY